MSDEITQPPAVIEDPHTSFEESANAELAVAPQLSPWTELTVSQKLDILHMKVDAMGAQTTWIGGTLQGIIDMVGKVSPMDIFKMMKGGK